MAGKQRKPAAKPKRVDHRLDAERDYLAGGVSYQDLASRYGVTKRTVERWGSEGNWDDRRSAIVGEVSAANDLGALADNLHDAQTVANQQLQDLEAFRKTLVEMLPEIRNKGGPIGPQGWIENYRRLQQAQRLVLGLPEQIMQPTQATTKGGTADEPASPQAGNLPDAVVVLPGKSTDWASLASPEARETGVDAEPGTAGIVPGVPGD